MSDSSGYCPRCNRTGNEREDDARAGRDAACRICNPSSAATPSPRPRLLDLFCGAGGAAMGYHRVGFDVVGVDNKPQPNYPFKFVQADALKTLAGMIDGAPLRGDFLGDFVAIHASPPCQRWLGVPGALGEDEYPDLIGSTRALLQAAGLPYVIENVPGAPVDGFVLCGSTFGLPVVRHRRFEAWPEIGLVPSACHQGSYGRGTEHRGTYPFAHGDWRPAWREHVLPVLWPWMTLEESHDAIPPAYTEFIGSRLLADIEKKVAATSAARPRKTVTGVPPELAERSAATASRWCWFALGLVAGELAGVLSIHFLTRPGVQLNWPVVGLALAGVTVLTFVAWRRDVR